MNLSKYSGSRMNGGDGDSILCEIYGERVLWGGNKKSAIMIRSQRETQFFTGTLNLDKSLYLYNIPKSRQARIEDFIELRNAQIGDELYSAAELAALPNQKD